MKRFIVALCMLFSVQTFATTIPSVPTIKQHPELPTGCEATALTMLLQYNNIQVSKTEVANQLPKAPYGSGQHPNDYFIGSPYSSHGFGVYAPAIARTLDHFAPNQSINLTNKSFSELLSYIDHGQPVIIWTTINMASPTQTYSWQTPYGTFTWIAPEHAVLMVGYDNHYIYYNDPITGKQEKATIATFKSRWASLGHQAVTFKSVLPSYDIVIDDKPLSLEDKDKAIYFEGVTWIPARILSQLSINLSVHYIDQQLMIAYKGTMVSLENQAFPGLFTKEFNNTYYVNLQWVAKQLDLSFDITEDCIYFSTNF